MSTTRPYAVRRRHKSLKSGNWQKWRTVGTYATQEAAEAAAERHKAKWTHFGYDVEAYVRKAGLYKQGDPA